MTRFDRRTDPESFKSAEWCNSGEETFLRADVQYLLRVNWRLVPSCKGKEWFDETSFRYKRQSDQGCYEGSGNCIEDEVDGEIAVGVATDCRR